MSILADHNRWLAGCRHVSNKGTHLTPGDIVHCGLGDYVESMGCPNGLPADTRTPDQVPAWREMIERARRDIAEWQRELRIADTAAGLSVEDVSNFIEEIRTWVKSRQWRVDGSTGSKPAGRG